ncbi:MAG TPA: protein-disulfide reductase DsbD domain-containing protein, partial [Allosphingosinicella sp.]|nr:protein-disulfide reductase DsbD domain-containing protein [Allosphingosinicella sp.]
MTLIALVFLLGPVAHAQLPARENAIAVSLLPAARQVPPGEKVALAVVMRPKPGWHGYWQNPGDAGAGAKVRWDLPPGVTAGPLRYPVPDRLIISGLMNYVYEREYALLTELRLPAGLPQGTKLPVRAKLDYLACTDQICVPESATVSTELEVGSGGPDNRALLARYARVLPRPLANQASFEVAGDRLRIAVPLPASLVVTDPYFYPATEGALDYSAVQTFAREGDLL